MNPETRIFPQNLVYVPPVSYGIDDFRKAVLKDKNTRTVTLFLFVFIASFLIAGLLSKNIFFILASFGFAAAFAHGMKLSYEQDVWFARFAQANNLQAINRTTPIDDLRGVVSNLGRDKYYQRGLADSAGKWMIAEYRFTTGSGKSSRENIIEIVRMKLPRALPNVVLDATANNFFGFSNLNNELAGHQKLQLEGDFNTYFTVYVPEGYERDALYFLTPELMQFLVQQGSTYDYEVVGNELLIYSSVLGVKPNEFVDALQKRFVYGEQIYAQFADNTRLYSDERVAEGAVRHVAAQGQLLKRKSAGKIISSIVFISFFIVWLLFFMIGLFSATN
jgi:hypothetical protein